MLSISKAIGEIPSFMWEGNSFGYVAFEVLVGYPRRYTLFFLRMAT